MASLAQVVHAGTTASSCLSRRRGAFRDLYRVPRMEQQMGCSAKNWTASSWDPASMIA